MYARHFGLAGDPFSIAPDPRFLFLSAAHREALAHLLYGVQGGGGFVLLTGDIGTGKTTVCRAFIEQLPTLPERVEVAFVLNPKLNASELLQTVCEEFGVHVAPATPAPSASDGGLKAPIDALNAHLLAHHATGGRSLLLIDEAQNLAPRVLEQLRLLTNLETHERKLLQIVLVGQPELRRRLASPRLEQLAQRVIARFHLGPLTREDSTRYIAHRLAVAGQHGEGPFDSGALRALHRLSGGVPRRLNLLADRALLGAYASGATRVNASIVRRAAAEVRGETGPARRWPRMAFVGAALLAVGVAAGVAAWQGGWREPLPAAAVTAAPPAAAEPKPATAAAPASAALTALSALSAMPALPAVTDEASGWQALAVLWGETRATPCSAAATTLRCFRAASFTLAQVRQLDRPGLVTLRDETTRQPRTALLLAADTRQVQLRLGEHLQTLIAAEFGARWLGDFATLWRARGEPDARASAEWLAAQLRGLPGAPPDGPTDRPTNSPASERVKAFQRAQGLVADGVPGALTLMQLNRVLGVAEPHLVR